MPKDSLLGSNASIRHLDEVYVKATSFLGNFLCQKTDPWRILLILDLTGRLRIVLWCPNEDWRQARNQCEEALAAVCGPYWSANVIRGRTDDNHPDSSWQEDAWNQAQRLELAAPRLRVLQRHRAKSAWFEGPTDPPWPGGEKCCTIAMFSPSRAA